MPLVVEPRELDPYQFCDGIFTTLRCLVDDEQGCFEHEHEHEEILSKKRNEHVKAIEYLDIWYHRDLIVELSVTKSIFLALLKLIDYKMGSCEEPELTASLKRSLDDFCRLERADLDDSDRIVMRKIPDLYGPLNTYDLESILYTLARVVEYMHEHFWEETNLSLHDVDYLIRVCKDLLVRTTHYRLAKVSTFYEDEFQPPEERKDTGMDLCSAFLYELKQVYISVKGIGQAIEPLARLAVSTEFNDSSRNHPLFLLLLIHGNSLAAFISELAKLAIDSPDDHKIASWLDAIIFLIREAVRNDADHQLSSTATWPLRANKNFQVTPINCCWLDSLIRNSGDIRSGSLIYPPERHFKHFFKILAPTGWMETSAHRELEGWRPEGICKCRSIAKSNDRTKDTPGPIENSSSPLLGLPKNVLHRIISALAAEDYFSLYRLSWTCRELRRECKELIDGYPWYLFKEMKSTPNRVICEACKDSVRYDWISNLMLNITFDNVDDDDDDDGDIDLVDEPAPLIRWHT